MAQPLLASPCFLSAVPLCTRPQPRPSLETLPPPQSRSHAPQLALRPARRAANVDGPFFVDESCIDCDTCRWLAPETFSKQGGKSAVHEQPRTEAAQLAALRAAAACPTASIRTEEPHKLSSRASLHFPLAARDAHGEVVPGVFYNGYTSAETFAASSWLSVGGACNVMVDCPRFSHALARQIERACGGRGVDFLVLTHADDVHGHERWAERLSVTRVIHTAEARARQGTDSAELQLDDEDFPFALGDGLTLLHTPGHTRGHVVLLDERSQSLFTGDHMSWGPTRGRLGSSPRFCWFSWEKQVESVRMLADLPFLHIWPGHGRAFHFDDDDSRRTGILDTADYMRAL